jgi:hypothetical protein
MVKVADIRIVKVEGMVFVCTPEGGRLDNALAVANYEQPDLKAYVLKDNVGELETVNVGDGKTTVSRVLRPDENLQYNVYLTKLAEVKKFAVRRLENDLFLKCF